MGRKAGFDASRGQIIFHLARILKDAQPKCFILKNVKNVAQHFALNEMSLLCSRGQIFYQLTGYEALLLQSFPKEYADKVKETVSDRHLVIQAGNAMTVNVINKLGNSLKEFYKEA